jgi:hypothetical protein
LLLNKASAAALLPFVILISDRLTYLKLSRFCNIDCLDIGVHKMTKIFLVLMCGDSATRVWPESRETLPKQFIPLVGERSTFQTTIAMVADPAFEAPINKDYRFLIADQLRHIGAEANIVVEPRAAIPALPSRAGPAQRVVIRRGLGRVLPGVWTIHYEPM